MNQRPLGYEPFSSRDGNQRATNNTSSISTFLVRGFGALWLSLGATSWVIPGWTQRIHRVPRHSGLARRAPTPGSRDIIDRPMEHHAEILGSITRLTSRSRRSSWTVLRYPDPAHRLLLPERRADLRGHAGRDTSDRQGGRFRRSGSGTAGRRSGRNSQRARRASVVRTTTRSEGRGRPSRDLSDSAIRRRSPRRSFTRISAAYQSLGSIPLPAYDVH